MKDSVRVASRLEAFKSHFHTGTTPRPGYGLKKESQPRRPPNLLHRVL
jgi:hypothetical protein